MIMNSLRSRLNLSDSAECGVLSFDQSGTVPAKTLTKWKTGDGNRWEWIFITQMFNIFTLLSQTCSEYEVVSDLNQLCWNFTKTETINSTETLSAAILKILKFLEPLKCEYYIYCFSLSHNKIYFMSTCVRHFVLFFDRFIVSLSLTDDENILFQL